MYKRQFLDSVEVNELRFPILVGVRRFAADTEGAGRYRDASSSEVEFAPYRGSMRVIYASDGTHNAAHA